MMGFEEISVPGKVLVVAMDAAALLLVLALYDPKRYGWATRSLTAMAFLGIRLVRSAPHSPWENPFSETFHSRLRDELVEREVFGSLVEAQILAEAYRQWYNGPGPIVP